MSLHKLYKRLRREVIANPKKAAILGGLLLVALYFWTPFFRGLVSEDRALGEPTTEGTTDGFGPLAQPKPAAPLPLAGDSPEPHSWEQLVQGIERDPATVPAAGLGGRRDPFQPAESETAQTETLEEAQEPQPDPQELTPESLKLALTSTLVGPRRRVALINGKAYREGQTVVAASGSRQVEFRLAEVHTGLVVLERLGEQFELKISQPTGAGRIELFASGD